MPVSADLEAIRRVVATGEPDVSELTRSAITGEPFIAVNVPVLRDGRLAYVLSLNIAPMLAAMVAGLNLPSEWLVTIADRAGRTIVRSRDAERFVGQMGRPAILERLRQADEGWLPLVSRDGIPIYNAFAHVKFSGWTISVGIPDDALFEPVRRSTRILIMAGAVTLAMALFLGMVIGRRIAGAITALVGYADLVGRGEFVVPQDTGIQETNSVAQSLHLAGERLRQSAQERAVLLDRTMIAQEAERKRIARELHDSLGQYLTALRLGFNAIDPFCAANQTAQQRLNQLKKLAGDLGRELNRMAWELRPMALDDLGLRRAVIQYLEEWADRSKLQIDMEIGGLDDRRLPQAVETALFRVLQEAITNVVKHSGASRVSVVLEATHDGVWLTVEDDGRGFDLNGADGQELGVRQLGLLGVRERLALVGGSLDVEFVRPERHDRVCPHTACEKRMTPGPVRVLMVDDHPVVLAGLKALVGADAGLTIVGEARDGRTALRMAMELVPDVVVLDISLPEMNGVELAAALRAERPECRVLVLTVHEERAYLRQLVELGVRGYLLKRSAADELPRAIHAVAAGGMYLDPAIAGKVIGGLARTSANPQSGQTAELSEREAAVLRLVAGGHSNKAISARLDISVKTVETYKARAMEKLGFRSRVDVVRYAADQGWLQEP